MAIIQSSFLPWKGYFDIIHEVDEFIFLDQVQYTVRDWRNRNRIKTAHGPLWLTVPVGSDRNRPIDEVRPVNNGWQEKHWKSIQLAYGRAPFFSMYKAFFQSIFLDTQWESLSKFNQTTTQRIAHELLGLRRSFVDSRAYAATGAKLDLILSLLNEAGATTYVSGPSALDYLEPDRFAACSIELCIKRYDYPAYQQSHPPFAHEVSIIDLLFNTGPDAAGYIWGNNT